MPDQTGPLPSTKCVIAGISDRARRTGCRGPGDDRADLQEGGEIIARREQEPNGSTEARSRSR